MLAIWLTAGLLAGAAEAPIETAHRFGGSSAAVRFPTPRIEEVEHEPIALEIIRKTLAPKAEEVAEAPATVGRPDLGALFGVTVAPSAPAIDLAPFKAVPDAEVMDAVYGQGHEIEFLLLLAA